MAREADGTISVSNPTATGAEDLLRGEVEYYRGKMRMLINKNRT